MSTPAVRPTTNENQLAMNAFTSAGQVEITVLVKALNEERHIEACLRSAQQALAAMPGIRGEVLLADSVSTDRTVAIAAEMGVRIVQFDNAADRSCGATLQLGYQYALGRYIYVLDGDMQLVPEFLGRAHAYLQANPGVAGVGGRLMDTHIRTEADRKRNEYYASLNSEQPAASLGGGGLYRREAIEQVGYLSNRWLPAYEEAELAVRLQAAGYRLVRLSDPAILHSGHAETSLQMLRRLWRSRRIDASGMFLRSALGRPWFGRAARTVWFVFAAPVVYAFAFALMAVAGLAGASWPIVVAMPLLTWIGVIGLQALKKRSLDAAVVSAMFWHLISVGALRGFLRPARDPMQAISARELSEQVRG